MVPATANRAKQLHRADDGPSSGLERSSEIGGDVRSLCTVDVSVNSDDETDLSSERVEIGLDSLDECPECRENLSPHGTETICSRCGLVVHENRIDHGPEWRVVGDGTGTNARRCNGAPRTVTRHDYGLGTTIGYDEVRSSKRAQFHRMRKYHRQAAFRSKAARNLSYSLAEIQRIVGQLALGRPLRDQAATLFRRAQSEDLLSGRGLDSFVAGSVYGATRQADLGRLPAEIAEVARCDEDSIKMAYSVLVREFNLPIAPPSPADHIPRIGSSFGLPAEVGADARRLACEAGEDQSLVGLRPSGIAGACIYLASQKSDISLTQQAVADVAGVTKVTIRSSRDALFDADEVRTEPYQ